MVKKLLPLGVMTLLTIFLIFGIHIYLYLTTPPGKGRMVKIINIRPGTKFNRIATELEEKGIIKNTKKFALLARLKRDVSQIKAGEYALSASMSPLQLLAILTRGEVVKHRVTIPEGCNISQIATLLEEVGVVDKDLFIKEAVDPSLLTLMGIEGISFEGYLFPDTYYFTKDTSEEEIIETMTNRFRRVFSKDFAARARELGFSEREVVTLASIIEKETASNREKYLVSAVFHNRLNKGIRLQSDPTVIYGLKSFNGDLTRRDLQKKTPYNTYRIGGLPLGPISNPGTEAIKAALYPADSNYLYFVSKNDGTHHFSRSLAEHSRAVEKYQRKRRYREVLK